MTHPLEFARQTLRAGPGYAAAAATAAMPLGRMLEALRGRVRLTPGEAAQLSAQTGQRAAVLLAADADAQLLANRNTAL